MIGLRTVAILAISRDAESRPWAMARRMSTVAVRLTVSSIASVESST